MNFFESMKSALESIKSNKLRSFLTMLGIIIGISSVITIVSLGDGGKKTMSDEFKSMGTNIVNINVNMNSDKDILSSDYFTLHDLEVIEKRINNVDAAATCLYDYGTAKTQNKKRQAQFMASTSNFLKVNKMDICGGRFINESDVEGEKDVAVIDSTTASKLFGSIESCIGSKIKMNIADNYINLTIVGVVKDPNEKYADVFGDNASGMVFAPITIADKIVGDSNRDISSISVSLKDMSQSQETSQTIVRLLENMHHNSNKYSVKNSISDLESVNKSLDIFTAIIGAIAGISLLVGGIGVMNIMLVSVTERTREIGIRKAIGATRKDIRVQFLTEAIILCVIGGITGMILGIVFGKIAGSFIHVTPYVSPKVVLISFLFSSGVGIFFGYYPANQAAKLDPIEALRYE